MTSYKFFVIHVRSASTRLRIHVNIKGPGGREPFTEIVAGIFRIGCGGVGGSSSSSSSSSSSMY